MNLSKLFDAQKVLMERIEKEHPPAEGEDRFNKRILSLLVEVGECANEWRGFKFWSKDQKPRTKKWVGVQYKDNEFGGLTPIYGTDQYKNPLLEEYVDGLHFVLELGITEKVNLEEKAFPEGEGDVIDLFLRVCECVNNLAYLKIRYGSSEYIIASNLIKSAFYSLLDDYLRLGAGLGFTWEEIEQAYFDKNAVNHQRQTEGY